MKKVILIFIVLNFSFLTFADSFTFQKMIEQIQGEGFVTTAKTKEIAGKEYVFIKYLDSSENLQSLIFDNQGNIINEEDIPRIEPFLISKAVLAIINDPAIKGNSNIELAISLKDVEIEESNNDPVEAVDEITPFSAFHLINNKIVSEYELNEDLENTYNKIKIRRQKIRLARISQIEKLLERNGFDRTQIKNNAMENGDGYIIYSIQKDKILKFMEDNAAFVNGIGINYKSEIHIASAMLDTNVDPYVLNYDDRQGDGIGIYMTEPSCPPSGHVINYYRIDSGSSLQSNINHAKNVSAIVRAVSPDSYLYCKGYDILPADDELDGIAGHPAIYVITSSSGSVPEEPDNPEDYIFTDKVWDNFVYDDSVVVFKSAGNNYNYVTTPGKGLNIITVGNYNEVNNNIALDSSYIDPQTGNQKPELVAPGTNITAGGFTYSGTSQAAPHAAAIAADFMGLYSWLKLRPHYIKAYMLSSSTDLISGGSDYTGVGGIDFRSGCFETTNSRYEGSNTSFSTFDANDPYPNNGYIDRTFTVSSASYDKIRVSISWLTRGEFTWENRTDNHPIGMDFDLFVYDPNGNLVGDSTSFDNSYEVVDFDPLVTGTYRVKIKLFDIRDFLCNIRLGLSINYDM